MNGQGTRALARTGPANAEYGLVALHGRGGSAADILGLVNALGLPDVAAVAPEARGRSWWPTSFLAPHAEVQPHLDRALLAVEEGVAALRAQGLASEKIGVLGFSQGACLAAEYVARKGGPLLGLWAFSGALIGTGDAEGQGQERLYGYGPKRFDGYAELTGVPAYISCHEADPHIPVHRVRESVDVFAAQGAKVETIIYPGPGHSIRTDDIAALRAALNT
ncbi:MAG: dienelactone hydrolase family protein [Pseudomonadota bacterium]